LQKLTTNGLWPSGALWRHAGFLRLWAAQTVSSFGARIAREGFSMAAILSIHATPAQLGVLTALARGPGIVVGLVAGGFVDRTSRKHVMIGSDLARVVLIATIPAAAWLGLLTMGQLYVVAALVGAASVLFDIADHAFLPALIDREFLLDGNAKLSVTGPWPRSQARRWRARCSSSSPRRSRCSARPSPISCRRYSCSRSRRRSCRQSSHRENRAGITASPKASPRSSPSLWCAHCSG
jgi:hypothetical protein